MYIIKCKILNILYSYNNIHHIIYIVYLTTVVIYRNHHVESTFQCYVFSLSLSLSLYLHIYIYIYIIVRDNVAYEGVHVLDYS